MIAYTRHQYHSRAHSFTTPTTVNLAPVSPPSTCNRYKGVPATNTCMTLKDTISYTSTLRIARDTGSQANLKTGIENEAWCRLLYSSIPCMLDWGSPQKSQPRSKAENICEHAYPVKSLHMLLIAPPSSPLSTLTHPAEYTGQKNAPFLTDQSPRYYGR